MELLKQRILKDGKIKEGNVLKVDSFLNHCMDITLIQEIGKEFRRLFPDPAINKILTIEASGIGIAAITAQYFGNADLVFAKKTKSKNLDGELYTVPVISYTRGTQFDVQVAKRYLTPEDNVLIIDDFLAHGQALQGLMEIVRQSGARLAGCGIVIEKGFQDGGRILREQGANLQSLAIIDSIENGVITFREEKGHHDMTQKEITEKKAGRFSGFADTYDRARPSVPDYPVQVVRNYLGRTPELIVDLGCGTGLSTKIWEAEARQVMGIEPNQDMLAMAKEKESPKASFRQGFGNQTGLEDLCADGVICSQSFHWMEPKSTLREINRILKPGGVFAAIDCDWPPVTNWQAEQAYMALYWKTKKLEQELPDLQGSSISYPKENHLSRMKESGYFRYCREILFTHQEDCSPQRLVDLLYSQGSVQLVLRTHPELIHQELEQFQKTVFRLFPQGQFPVEFCYRMRIGIK